MTLSLIIVVSFLLLGLGLIIIVSSPKLHKTKPTVIDENIAPLIFATPLLSWLVYVKYNEIETSLFISGPIAVLSVMLLALSLILLNLRK